MQFEGYLPTKPDLKHQYDSPRHASIGGMDFYVETWIRASDAKVRQGFGPRARRRAHPRQRIHGAGGDDLCPPRASAGEQKRKELMIIYGEDVAPTGFTTAELQEGGKGFDRCSRSMRSSLSRCIGWRSGKGLQKLQEYLEAGLSFLSEATRPATIVFMKGSFPGLRGFGSNTLRNRPKDYTTKRRTEQMKLHRWEDMKRQKLSREKLEKIEQKVEREVLTLNLKALREELGKTQSEIAALAEMDQSEISKAERREDHLVSTLRRYVEALGGRLEVVARVGEKRIRLEGV